MLWKRCSLALLLFLSFCFVGPKLHAGSVVILQGDKAGEIVKAWYAPSKSSIAVLADRIVRISGGPSDPSDPPIDPPIDPPNDSELKTLSSTWPEKVEMYAKRNDHRRGLSAMYLVLSKRQKDGGFSSLDQMRNVTLEFRDLILASDKEKWDPWGGDIGVYLAAHVSSLDEAGDAYLDVAAGLESSEAISDFMMQIIEAVLDALLDGSDNPIIAILIKLLLAVLGGGG